MGKENQYDLRLAHSVSTIASPDTETDEDISLVEIQLSGISHPTKLLKNACTKMLKLLSVCVGQHANKMDKNALHSVSAMFRTILQSKKGTAASLGLEHWTTLGFLRSISTANKFSKFLTSPVWINFHLEILNSVTTCEQDVYKKVQCLRLLQHTLVTWSEEDAPRVNDFIDKICSTLGKIGLYCPNDLSLLQNPIDVKARVPLASSHSGTVAEEIIILLRKLHTLPMWNAAINTTLSRTLCMATQLLSSEGLNEGLSTQSADSDKSDVVAGMILIGGCDPRPRIGLHLTFDGMRGTVTGFTHKGKALVSIHNSMDVKKLSISTVKDSADVGAFSLSRLPLNEMLLNSWAVIMNGPAEWKSNIHGNIDLNLLRGQQIHLAALNATCVLFRHQSSLRKILRQRTPGLSRYSSDESIDENPFPVISEDATLPTESLMHSMLARAIQTNPVKAHYTYADMSMAALNISQLLASQIHTEMHAPLSLITRPLPPPVQPTLIHGIPIYNDGVVVCVLFFKIILF